MLPKRLSLGYCLALRCLAIGTVAHKHDGCAATHLIGFTLSRSSPPYLDPDSISEWLFGIVAVGEIHPRL